MEGPAEFTTELRIAKKILSGRKKDYHHKFHWFYFHEFMKMLNEGCGVETQPSFQQN